jgi:ribosomal-protein-serine acetyltransferase
MQFNQYHIRQLEETDLENYFLLIDKNRQRLEDFFAGTVAITKTMEETQKHLSDVINKAKDKQYFPFIVEDTDSGKIISSIQVKNFDWNVPKAEIGYYVDQDYEGKGIVSKATSLIVDFCFEELALSKLFIRTHEANAGSRKVAEKNGFLLEGTIRRDYRTTSGELVDLMYYGLLKEEHLSNKAK